MLLKSVTMKCNFVKSFVSVQVNFNNKKQGRAAKCEGRTITGAKSVIQFHFYTLQFENIFNYFGSLY